MVYRILLCLLLGPLGSAGAAPFTVARPSLRAYTSENGLPDNTVYALMQDHHGRLWTSTLEGVASYTGRGWSRLPLPPECPSRSVRGLLETRDGALWVGTQDGGLWQLRKGVWTGYSVATGLPDNRINSLVETQDANGEPVLWVGTGNGLAKLHRGVWQTVAEPSPEGLMVWRIRAWKDSAGRPQLWAATNRGLFRQEGGGWVQGLPSPPARDFNDVLILEGSGTSREIWVSAWGEGLLSWRGGKWQRHGPESGFPSRFPTRLELGRDGSGRSVVWAGTYDAGLVWGTPGTWQRIGLDEGLGAPGVLSLLTVEGGKPDVWLGTRGGGLVGLDLGGWRTLGRPQGLPGDEVSAFAEDASRGRFWIGTGAGVVRWEEGRWQPEKGPGAPAKAMVSALLHHPEGQGELWVATLGGLYRVREGRWSPAFKDPLRQADSYACLALATGESGTEVWAGGQGGLACFRAQGVEWFDQAQGRRLDWLSALQATGRGQERSLWVGTWGGGVLRYHQGQWTRWGTAEGLPRPTICALQVQQGRDGRTWVWAATLGGGFARLEAERPGARWEAFNQDRLPGLLSNVVQSLLLDPTGCLYLGGPKGVTRVRLEERGGVPTPIRAESHTTGDGLPTPTCLTNASLQDAQGRIWVGTARGAAVLDPGLETLASAPSPPEFEGVEVGSVERALQPDMVFRHGDTRLTFRFSLRGFHRREDARFRTQLIGLEREATPWLAAGQREFTGLPAGRYRLRLWARDFAGRQSGPVDLPFRVLPSPWLGGWALAGYGLLAVGLVLLWVRLRTLRLRRRALELERAVEAALAEVQVLQGLIPICAYCKKIRDDSGFWAQLEHYLSAHAGAQFSHGVCPDCEKSLRREMAERRNAR